MADQNLSQTFVIPFEKIKIKFRKKSKTFILDMSKTKVFAFHQYGFAVCNNLRFAFGNKTLNPHSFVCSFKKKLWD